MISCGFFGYAINTIGSIFQDIAEKKLILKQKKYDICTYMSSRNLSYNLQNEILK
jgi:hypothetical protein